MSGVAGVFIISSLGLNSASVAVAVLLLRNHFAGAGRFEFLVVRFISNFELSVGDLRTAPVVVIYR